MYACFEVGEIRTLEMSRFRGLRAVVDGAICTSHTGRQKPIFHPHLDHSMLLMIMVPYCCRPRPPYCRAKVEEFFDMISFDLLFDYFAVKVVREDVQAMEDYVFTHRSCLLAQFPLSLAVRYCGAQVVHAA